MRFQVKVHFRFLFPFLLASFLGLGTFAGAQQTSPASPTQATTGPSDGSSDGTGSPDADPLKRQLSEQFLAPRFDLCPVLRAHLFGQVTEFTSHHRILLYPAWPLSLR